MILKSSEVMIIMLSKRFAVIIGMILLLITFSSFVNFYIDKNDSSKVSKEEKKLEDKFSDYQIIPNGIGVNVYGRPTENEIKLMKEAGIKWVRIDLVWSNIEKSKGIYDFRTTGYDQFVGLLQDYDIRPYFILDYSNELYEKEMSITSDAGRKAFTKFTEVAVERYKNIGAIWEIWNEPNLESYWESTPSFEDYTLLVKSISLIIRKNDDSSIIVAPALAGVRGDSLNWLEETFRLNILNYIDAISVHPYRKMDPETVEMDYDILKTLLKEYSNKNIPIISGEWGYYLENIKDKEHEEIEQAQNIIRMMLINYLKDVPISILYEWKNSGTDPRNMHDNYGLMENSENPKLSYYAVKNFISTLEGYSFLEKLETQSRADYLLKFVNNEGNVIIVLWTTGTNHIIDYKYPAGKGKLINMMGEQRKIDWNKKISIELSRSPIYIKIE